MWAYPEIRLLGDTLSYHARHTPERLALVYEGQKTSFGELDALANRFARRLRTTGVQSGDRVLFYGKNSFDFFLAMYGAAKAGACFVPLNWRLAPVEVAAILNNADGRLAIVETESASEWEEICAKAQMWPETVRIDREATLSKWCADESSGPAKYAVREDDPAIILYTSGTTGTPKGVVHTHASFNHSRLAEHFERVFEWREGDVFLNPLPNFHLLHIALSLQCLYNGVAISIQRAFDPKTLLEGVASQRPTLLILTPTLIQLMLDHPLAAGADFSSVRLTMYAGSPISLGLIKRAMSMMPGQFMQFYGHTETSGPVSLLRPDEHRLDDEQKLKSCGRPLPLIQMKIVAIDGSEAPVGQPGELVVSAPAATAGYWRQPELTEAKFQNGWYRTGDIAYRDAEGLFYIYDRANDMIITGGENVYSTEVENVLSLHPAVGAVAVIGVPDPRWGEAIKAVVVRREGQSASAEEILAFCRTRLAKFKLPKSIDFVAVMPVTGTGKIAKKTLRAPYWKDMQRSVA